MSHMTFYQTLYQYLAVCFKPLHTHTHIHNFSCAAVPFITATWNRAELRPYAPPVPPLIFKCQQQK